VLPRWKRLLPRAARAPKMKVSALLEALPGVGKVRARQIMEEIGISESRRVRGLGTNQVAALVERFTR
jgi:ribosomal protein S13